MGDQEERNQQSLVLVNAIWKAIEGCATEELPITVIARALVTIEACILISVQNPAERNALMRKMDKSRATAIVQAMGPSSEKQH